MPSDVFMGRYGYLRDEAGLETVESSQVLAKQVETPSSILSSNLLEPGFHSQVSGKGMELRPRENPKDHKERCQLYWRKVAALTGTSRRPRRGHPYTHKCIKKDASLWIRIGFGAFWIGLEMNFNPSATHLQILDYQVRAPRNARQGMGQHS